jgi:hypothetical protein
MMAAEKVKDRLRRATAALSRAAVPYAVIGGNAVAEWVGQVDGGAVRTTRDVDILISRADLEAAKVAMRAAGFEYHHSFSVDMFIDGPNGRASDAVHLIFAGERVRANDVAATPEVDQSEPGREFQVIALDALVRMKLTSYRRKDQVHLEDMIGVGLVDATWPARLPPELAARLQQILDTPEG